MWRIKESAVGRFLGVQLLILTSLCPCFTAGADQLSIARDALFYLSGNGQVASIARMERAVLGRGGDPLATEFIPLNSIKKLATGEEHVLALTNQGNVFSWGSNIFGQINSSVGIALEPAIDSVKEVFAGAYSSYALKVNGELWARGRNNQGQLGLGDLVDRSTWTKVTLPSGNVRRVSAGIEHVLVQIDGIIYGFGSSSFGQLLQTGVVTTPTLISNARIWGFVEAGGFHSAAIDGSGNVWTWGKNTSGQLGLGAVSPFENVPHLVSPLQHVIQVEAGYDHTLYLTSGNGTATLWSSGSDRWGQSATTLTSIQASPVMVQSNPNLWEIEAGPYSSTFKILRSVMVCGQHPDGRNLFVPELWLYDPFVGFTCSANQLSLLENGASANIVVVLRARPASGNTVQIDISNDQPSEVLVQPSSLLFTSANWAQPQVITITSIDDNTILGNDFANITLSVNALVSDLDFQTLPPRNIPIVLIDTNDPPQIGVGVGNAMVNEDGYGNLLTNASAETANLSGWTILNGGDGWNVAWGVSRRGQYSFISSYAWGTIRQEIDLVAKGYSASFLDSSPTIQAGVSVKSFFWDPNVTPVPDFYSANIILRNAAHEAVAHYFTGTLTAPLTWTEVSHEFQAYGSGVRFVDIQLMGKDVEFWAGQHGAIFDEAFVRVASSPQATVSLTKFNDDGPLTYDASALLAHGWTTTDGGNSFDMLGHFGTAKLLTLTDNLTYTLDNMSASTNALTSSNIEQDSFWVQVTDGLNSANTMVNFFVHGSNDAPNVANDGFVAIEKGSNPSSGNNAVGNILSNDVDIDSSTLTIVACRSGNVEGLGLFGTIGGNTQGQYGVLFIQANGSFIYEVNNSAPVVDALSVGQNLEDVFNVDGRDEHGAIDCGVLTITITGVDET